MWYLALIFGNALSVECIAEVDGFLKTYCQKCHGPDEANAQINFSQIIGEQSINSNYVVWEKAVQHLRSGTMPPSAEKQPSPEQKQAFIKWYEDRFIENVEPFAGEFRPRRLCATEYRNTLESMFGFSLDVAIIEAEQTVVEKSLVMKLLPPDPPGPSGFRNDTSGNPLTSVVWDQYSYLVDNGLQKLFSTQHRNVLEEYVGPISGQGVSTDQAATLLTSFLQRANRRTVSDHRLKKTLSTIAGLEGPALASALKQELKAILMSPTFLYRGLLMNVPTDSEQPVDQFELAERLSYFLWADMPDEELLETASSKALRNETALREQVDRMLASPKARRLAEDFGVQWFTLQEIEKVSNNPPVADALYSQPIDFLNYLFTKDRPVIELIDSTTTFINPHTAKYYPKDRNQMTRYRKQRGIEVEAVANSKITLHKTPERGGLLTMPGVLAMNRGPILRGTWILERVLGEELPDPPPDVGQVPARIPGRDTTFRERFELHRSNPTCAVCHNKIDPLGFALQRYGNGGSFTQTGQEPVKKKKKKDVSPPLGAPDTRGQLPTGEEFADFAELKQILVTGHRETVIRNAVRRMISYALCRRLEYYDRPAIEAIVDHLMETNGTYRDLIHQIVMSLPFQKTVVRSDKLSE